MSQTAKANSCGTPSQDHHPFSGFSPEHRSDPSNPSVSVFCWKQASTGLATRRQLRAMGLRPGGQEPAARIDCRGGRRFAWLHRIDPALSVRPMTLAKEAALDKAMAARTTCPICHRRYHHALPLRTLGSCLECHPTAYIALPVHNLAA
ncbi:RRQRL motif-containing zinc-binding protein [Streptomyces sp. NPDC048737]|uniref:RRQRL motif-containing zinc-binding protein n=1 Tax=unclassified Streptomyces TaxID=2593676 RepID=UPI003414ADE6